MLSVRCLSVLPCPVTFLNDGQAAGRIKMKLRMQVGLGPGHCVLGGDPAARAPKRHPQFSAHIYCGQMAGWIKMPLGMEEGLGPGDFVLDGDQLPSPKMGRRPLPNLRPMSSVAKRLDASRCHLVRM